MNKLRAKSLDNNDPSELAEAWTDRIFKDEKVVEKKGDKTVTYAVFMRRLFYSPQELWLIG